jgi:hypothetical protein
MSAARRNEPPAKKIEAKVESVTGSDVQSGGSEGQAGTAVGGTLTGVWRKTGTAT